MWLRCFLAGIGSIRCLCLAAPERTTHIYLHLWLRSWNSFPVSSLQRAITEHVQLIELHIFPSKAVLRASGYCNSEQRQKESAPLTFPGICLFTRNFKPLGLATVEQVNEYKRSWCVCVRVYVCMCAYSLRNSRQWWTLTLNSLCSMTRNAAPYSSTAREQRANIVFKKCCLTKGPSQSLKWTPIHPSVCPASY